jgi:hypothetical protein
MTYLCWAAMYEGETDAAYFDVLIPRLMEDIITDRGLRESTIPASAAVRLPRDAVETVARQACEAAPAFHLIFMHADTGGRGLESGIDRRSERYCEAMTRLCAWPPERCVTITPRHETEAWILADPDAVTGALGYSGRPADIGLPADASEAERLGDPKAILAAAARAVRGSRRPLALAQTYPAIAQRQAFHRLRGSRSFRACEANLCRALASLGCIAGA